MAMNDEQLEVEIMKLDLDARARLAEKLILSLDAPSDEENLRLWVAEAERRLRPWMPVVAKGAPLSVRIARGSPPSALVR